MLAVMPLYRAARAKLAFRNVGSICNGKINEMERRRAANSEGKYSAGEAVETTKQLRSLLARIGRQRRKS